MQKMPLNPMVVGIGDEVATPADRGSRAPGASADARYGVANDFTR